MTGEQHRSRRARWWWRTSPKGRKLVVRTTIESHLSQQRHHIAAKAFALHLLVKHEHPRAQREHTLECGRRHRRYVVWRRRDGLGRGRRGDGAARVAVDGGESEAALSFPCRMSCT